MWQHLRSYYHFFNLFVDSSSTPHELRQRWCMIGVPIASAMLTHSLIAILLAIFAVLSRFPIEAVLSRIALTPSASPLVYLRPLLAATNTDPNVRCLAMKCLLHLPPKLWTGVSVQSEYTDATKKALTIEEHEVGNIMGFLGSVDPTLRALVSVGGFSVLRRPRSRRACRHIKC